MWGPWLCWLLAILAGVTYQYCAAKYLEDLELKNGSLFHGRASSVIFLRHWAQNPYQLYAVLLIFFHVGTIWFAATAAMKLTN